VITVKTKHLIVLLFITAIISITATNILYSFYVISDVKELDMSLIVGEHIGFDAGTDKITFGMITRSGSCRRDIFLSNQKDYPLKVYVSLHGNFKEWVYLTDDFFILKPGEEKKISFTVSAPADAAYGNYTGKARFVFKRVI